MSTQPLSHLSNPALLQRTFALVAQGNVHTAELLVHLAEVDARKLYRPEGYPSRFAWCVGALKLSEDAAAKRIQAARAAREHPAIFPMVEEGRLTLSAIGLLAPHLKQGAGADLVEAAAGKSNREVERLLAERFPRPDVPTVLRTFDAPAAETPALALAATSGSCEKHAARHVEDRKSLGRTTPLAPGRHLLQVTLPDGPHEKLRYLQALLGHAVPSGDLVQVLDRVFDLALAGIEKQQHGAGGRSRSGRRHNPDSRYIPVAVRRIVWERDGGRCTFVSEKGHRCEATRLIEFDHVEPFARGGEATPSGLRLRCRAHNQYDAEQKYGAEFMRLKLEEAKRRAAERRAKAEEREAEKARKAQEREAVRVRKAREDEVIPALNALGCFGERARHAASVTVDMVGATLEERVKRALQAGAPHCTRYSADGRRLT